MNKTLILLSVLSPLLLWGCGSSKSASSGSNGIPNWVNNPSSEFNEQKYLMAVGSGSTLNEARGDAFASLSQIFQMDIDATEQLNSEFIDRNINNQLYSESTSQLLNNIKIGTNQELMNTTILTSEVDKFGTYHALAGMDRAESSRIYNQEISNNRIKINELEQNADSENNILQKLVLLKKAQSLATANEILTRQLNVIRGGTGTGGEATETLVRLQEKFRTAQQKAIVKLASGNATSTVKSAVASVLQNAGFTIAESTDNAILAVNVNYLTQKADLNRDDAEFVKWELVIEVNDLQTNRSFKTYMTEGRDGAPSYADALKRADFTARSKIEKEFNTFLNNELLQIN
ncbi:MAG: LPP20 family lipoprotein [Gracilimonas sp.]|uniref:LPP20 family lipoprotein n=1 Tax=Gracilimonas TaxID=649462 RepID=UPI001B19FBA3|nr:LPP20 family lipoprotein [Gracilimonas sp.]MBO6586641.1 LPP20 family lipoprotein [Gracilimonas sp.]MBO6615298.1 LPP20 family lipoprotein [Gracilimonas sp.]